MTYRRLADHGSFELWRLFRDEMTNHDRLIQRQGAWFRDRRISRSRARARSLKQEIGRRYQAVLLTYLRRARPSPAAAASAPSEKVQEQRDLLEILAALDEAAVSSDTEAVLPAALWKACERTTGCSLPDLKPRFMLRPFVDLVDRPEHREILIWAAYDSQQGPSPADSAGDLEPLLQEAVSALEQALVTAVVSAWTDGAIGFAEAATPDQRQAQILSWLIPA
jgi:hypothetical protein